MGEARRAGAVGVGLGVAAARGFEVELGGIGDGDDAGAAEQNGRAATMLARRRWRGRWWCIRFRPWPAERRAGFPIAENHQWRSLHRHGASRGRAGLPYADDPEQRQYDVGDIAHGTDRKQRQDLARGDDDPGCHKLGDQLRRRRQFPHVIDDTDDPV